MRQHWFGALNGPPFGLHCRTCQSFKLSVNFCLVPEVPLVLEGSIGFLQVLERRLALKHHAVIVVAGQDLIATESAERDPSGNLKLKDIGVFLKQKIEEHLSRQNKPINLKYINPSREIRGLPANATNSQFCLLLGQFAVHTRMAGKTNMVVGHWNQRFTPIPIAVAVAQHTVLDPGGVIWQSVLDFTHQPQMI